VSVRGLAGLAVFVAALLVPALGSRFYTFLANDVIIWALFATSLNLLVGYTGLVSFGHGAWFGLAAYGAGLAQLNLFPGSILLPIAVGLAVVALACHWGSTVVAEGIETAAELDVDRLADVLEQWHVAAASRFVGGRPADRRPVTTGVSG